MKKNKLLIVLPVILTIGLFFLAKSVYQNQKTENSNFVSSDHFIRPHSPVFGPKEAKVILVEFLDPECESCRKFYPYVKHLLKEFEGKVKLVVRYTPFHQNSKYAIRVLEASKKQNLYWETLSLMFETQPQWGDHHNPRPELILEILSKTNLNINQLKIDMNDPAIDKIVMQDIDDGIKLDVKATPTFFVNQKPLPSFGFEQLKQALQNEVNFQYKKE